MIFGSIARTVLQVKGWPKQFEPDRKYLLTKINLVRAAAPQEIVKSKQNQDAAAPIIIEKNRPIRPGSQLVGRVENTSYAPSLIVVAGAEQRERLLDAGTLRTWAWVEAGAISNLPEHQVVSPSKFLQMMQAALERTAFRGRPEPLPGQSWPVLTGAFPLHQILSYQVGKRVGQASYRISDDGKRIDLVDAGTGYNTLPRHTVPVPSSRDEMKDEDLPKYRKAWGSEQSELMLRIANTWENQREALRMYLQAIQNGTYVPLTPSFAPVPLTPEHKIGKVIESKAGTSFYDFARWTTKEQETDTKRIDGQLLNQRHFAYIGSASDKSTWLLPIHTANRVRRAYKQVNGSSGIAKKKHEAVITRIQNAAKRFGVDLTKAE